MSLVLYGALALTLITALALARRWGSTAGLVFAALNLFVIFVFPLGKLLGLAGAGGLLYLLLRDRSNDDDSAAPAA